LILSSVVKQGILAARTMQTTERKAFDHDEHGEKQIFVTL